MTLILFFFNDLVLIDLKIGVQNYGFISSDTIIFYFYEAIPAVHYIRAKSAGCRYHQG